MAATARRVEEDGRRLMSAEARAQLIADSIGSLGDGDYRKRVFHEALYQIRCAVAIASQASNFYEGTDLGR